MKTARLVRMKTGDAGTFGVFLTDGGWWWSLELPDRENAPNVSRIPAGEYLVARSYSPRFRRQLYLVESVAGRSGVRLHAGTWAGDTAKGFRSHLRGCIALGLRTAMIRGQAGLLHSSRAIQAMTETMGREPFRLIVQENI